jgi:hypothetical protein
MAFEVAETKFKKANDIPVGGSIEGFVIGQYNGGKFPLVDCIKMRNEEGTFILSGNGTLKYFFKNSNKPGFYYRFTRLPDVVNKMKQTVSQWKIEIDREKTCEAEAPMLAPETHTGDDANIPF